MMGKSEQLELHCHNNSPVFATIPDLSAKGYVAGAGSVVLTHGWQNPVRPQSGMGYLHVGFRHRLDMQLAQTGSVEAYISTLLSKPYRIYDLGFRQRLLIYRSVRPFGGVIVEPANARDVPEIRCNLSTLGVAETTASIYLVVTAYNKKAAEGAELWVQRR